MFLKCSQAQVPSPQSAQTGAALIVALLIVFIVAALSVSVSGDFLLMIKRVENQTHGQQAYAYLVGSEGLGRWAVMEDPNLNFDHPSEEFMAQPIVFANDIAQFTGVLSDLQGRLNINNLRSASSGGSTAYSTDQQRFIRLLQTLDLKQVIDQQTAEEITNAVVDWLDEDSIQAIPGGAEDLYYGDAEPAGRAANGLMVSVSELRWVKGISAEIYQALSPHLTVWGDGAININTATENVLRSLNKSNVLRPLSAMDINELIVEQHAEAEGFNDLTVFESPSMAGFEIDVSGLAVKSDTFLLSTKVLMLEKQYQLNSVIKREADKATVIARSRTSF